jgi:hypothetical protein
MPNEGNYQQQFRSYFMYLSAFYCIAFLFSLALWSYVDTKTWLLFLLFVKSFVLIIWFSFVQPLYVLHLDAVNGENFKTHVFRPIGLESSSLSTLKTNTNSETSSFNDTDEFQTDNYGLRELKILGSESESKSGISSNPYGKYGQIHWQQKTWTQL